MSGIDDPTATAAWHHVGRDGVRIAARVSGPPDGAPDGAPVLLVHGWPDTSTVWRHQIRALDAAGHRTVAVDLRGAGRSDRPGAVEAYAMPHLVGDLVAVLDELAIDSAHVVGHDWGGAIASVLAALVPDRVATLTLLSVGHPGAFATAGWRQREMSWYMHVFQFDVAERWLTERDFANLREWSRHPDVDEVVSRYADPVAVTAGLALYRANVPPSSLVDPPLDLPPILAPTLAISGAHDRFVTVEALAGTASYVTGPWRHEVIADAGHWMQLDRPEEVDRLLLGGLRAHVAGAPTR